MKSCLGFTLGIDVKRSIQKKKDDDMYIFGAY